MDKEYQNGMTTDEVFRLRKQGRTEEAYESARGVYATDKGGRAALAMFWTAVDMLRLRVREGKREEAGKILLALERMLPRVPDREGAVRDAIGNCRQLLDGEDAPTPPSRGSAQEESGHNQMGQWGEEVAANYLYGKGYDIVGRNWHSGHRDIDIIVQRGNMTVFVEVKTRRNRDFGDPLDAIDRGKLYHLSRAINHYLRSHRTEDFRFDVITVVGPLGTPDPDITHIEDVNIVELETARPRRRRPW